MLENFQKCTCFLILFCVTLLKKSNYSTHPYINSITEEGKSISSAKVNPLFES